MTWVTFGIAAGFFFAIYNAFLKLSSSHLHALVGSISLSIASALITLGLIFVFKTTGQQIDITSKGVRLACIAGVFSAFGGLFYFLMYQKKAPLNLGLPLLSIATILFSVLIGLIFFQEKLTSVKLAGIILAIISIYLLGI